MNGTKRVLPAAILVTAIFVAACSSTTPATTSGEGDVPSAPEATSAPEAPSAPETTSAPEPTSAPETTSAPDTTAAPVSSESDSENTNAGMIWLAILAGVLLLGLVVWFASRSGSKRGAQQQTVEQEAAAYEAEHRLPTDRDLDQ